MRKFKNKIKFFLIVSLLVIPGISVFAAEDLPENLKPLAEKLGCSTKEECANVFEKNFDQNIQFADSLGVYDGDKTKKDIVNSYKEEVINKLSGVGSPEELEERIVELAKGLVKSKPQLAKKFDIGENQIKAVENAVSKAKEIGVSFSQCQKMDPESAPVQLLRGCAKLAKEKVVQSYIPEKDREKADMAEKMADLQEALDSGKYQCGNGTAEGCGNFCLNPDAEVRKSGIPEVCKQIAKDFFGSEGEAELERAYSQVGQVAQFYNTKAKNVTFKTSDGKTLYDPKAIGQHMQELAAKGDVENLEKGMDFMIANGFVKPEDKGFVLDMVKGVKESGRQGFDINECAKNPAGCQGFVPEHIRSKFDSGRKVEEIMKAEFAKQGLGGNPGECEDPTKGELCLKASKSALSQLESLASESPEVKFIVNEIKQRIEFGEKGMEAKRKAEEEFRSAGNKITIGDREFTDFSQVNEFCKLNGQVCLAEGAKRGFVEKDFAVEKYQHSFDESERFGGYNDFPSGDFEGGMPFGFPGPSDFPGQGPQGQPFQGGFPGGPSGQFPGQGQTQGQFPGGQNFSQQGFPGQFKIDKQKALADFQKWLENPEGAPPVPNFGSMQSSESDFQNVGNRMPMENRPTQEFDDQSQRPPESFVSPDFPEINRDQFEKQPTELDDFQKDVNNIIREYRDDGQDGFMKVQPPFSEKSSRNNFEEEGFRKQMMQERPGQEALNNQRSPESFDVEISEKMQQRFPGSSGFPGQGQGQFSQEQNFRQLPPPPQSSNNFSNEMQPAYRQEGMMQLPQQQVPGIPVQSPAFSEEVKMPDAPVTVPVNMTQPTSAIDTSRFVAGVYSLMNYFTDLISGR